MRYDRRVPCDRALLAVLALVAIDTARSQANTSVVSHAEDAFGERIGTEQLGLYSESQVRSFSLQSAGNYRIDGHYFVRAAQLPDSVLDGVSIHVGSSALRTDFPAPSGVVGLRMKTAPRGTAGVSLETGLRRYETPFVQVDAWHADDENGLSVAGGVYASNDSRYSDGTRGDEYSAGLVPRWRIGNFTLTGLAGWSRRSYNGDYKFVSDTDALPPRLRGDDLFGPPWARYSTTTHNVGVAADYLSSDGWHFRGSTFLSGYDEPAADFTVLETDAMLRARARTSLIRDQESQSLSSELFAARRFEFRNALHRIYGAVRHRKSDSLSTSGQTFESGFIDLRRPSYDAPPALDDGVAHRDTTVEQVTAALGWELNAADRLQIRFGTQRSNYRKTVASSGALHSTEDTPWLYDAAMIVPLRRNWLVYASYTRGLEEQGVAPRNAVNRNEVLPVVEAEQFELGFKGRLPGDMSLVAAAFQISKPTAAFDEVGRFGVIGEVRHRGAEMSLTGRVAENLSLAAGVMALKPELSGPLVTIGRISSRPVGIQKVAAQVTSDYDLKSVPGLSVDVQVNYAGDRLATFDATLRTPARTTLNLGARYRFKLRALSAVLRLRIQNATDVHDWSADSSGLLSREQARSYMLSLAITGVRDTVRQ
jgi:iron complex outermembrane receptor protein